MKKIGKMKKKKMIEETQLQWSQLPNHITEMIIDQLSFPDNLRFGLVCAAWRWVVAETQRRRPLSSQQLHPWVMFDYNFQTNTCSLFNFQENRIYSIKLPSDFFVMGSSKGWLIFIDPRYNLYLFNPFTGTRINLPHTKTIKAPSIPTFFKVILSSSPTSSNNYDDCIVVALNSTMQLAFCRPRDKSWTLVKFDSNPSVHPPNFFVGDLISCKRWAYALCMKQHLWVFDLADPNPASSCFKVEVVFPVDHYGDLDEKYLVEESQGNLLLVLRFKNRIPEKSCHACGDTIPYCSKCDIYRWRFKTFKFLIYKLMVSNNNNNPRWVRQSSLDGDQVLFLGKGCSKLFSATECPGLQGNSIYFTDESIFRLDRPRFQYCDMGIYHVEDGRIDPYLPLDSSSKFPHIWITPSV